VGKLWEGVRVAAFDEFFAYARKRHTIYLKRLEGRPWPWTDDPILRQFRFTNVFRELDRTTQWFRQFIRDEMRAEPEVLLATVLFRWFNRIETCRIIFCQQQLDLRTSEPVAKTTTPWNLFLETGDTRAMRSALVSAFPEGPYVTGAYMIRSPTGMSKLDGMLRLCSDFYKNSFWREKAEGMLLTAEPSVERFTNWLRNTPGQGPFLAYEVACDLIYTDLLCRAPDIMTWANPGPGAQRGLNRLRGRLRANPRKPRHLHRARIGRDQALDEMRELLALSQRDEYWPSSWQQWDMRTVEHTLCEFDKYERVRTGEGRPRQLFNHTG